MRFFKFTATIQLDGDKVLSRESEFERKMFSFADRYAKQSNFKEVAFIAEVSPAVGRTEKSDVMFELESVLITDDYETSEENVRFPWEKFRLNAKNISAHEIGTEELNELTESATDTHHFFRPLKWVFRNKNMGEIWNGENFFGNEYGYEESVIPEKITKKSMINHAKTEFWGDDLLNEYKRIESVICNKFYAHPVHYVFCSDDYESRSRAVENLIYELYKCGRLMSKRFGTISLSNMRFGYENELDKFYQCCEGGTVVIRYRKDACSEEDLPEVSADYIEAVCECIRKHSDKVLTILCFPSDWKKEKEQIVDNLYEMSFVEIKQGRCDYKGACAYLRKRAKDSDFAADEELTGELERDRKYMLFELDEVFKKWEDKQVRNCIFPQYKDFSAVRMELAEEKPKSAAYDTLNEMIGLSAAKETIEKALNFYRVRKLFKDKGRKAAEPSMHMVFTGNPGTAKTTVARLVSAILRDNEILSKGHLVEVGRKDLIAKYVGQTAPRVAEAFKRASGGILFIDEAYSLVDGHEGLFGDEAIATIVQEMENHRDDVIVIFAGYPEPMEKFLSRNPGLRSRIAFHVAFNDYSPEELVKITRLMTKNQRLQLADGCDMLLYEIYEKAVLNPEFGNGRYARNVIEHALMNQASRLVKLDVDSITDEVLNTLTLEDFKYVEVGSAEAGATRRIGFC